MRNYDYICSYIKHNMGKGTTKMKGNPQTIKGKGFAEHPENINRSGRPKKLVNIVNDELKAEGFEPMKLCHFNDAAMQIMQLPLSRVMEIANTKTCTEHPLIYKLICKELLGKNGQNFIEKLLDRAHGKASQSVDLKSSDGSMTPTKQLNENQRNKLDGFLEDEY